MQVGEAGAERAALRDRRDPRVGDVLDMRVARAQRGDLAGVDVDPDDLMTRVGELHRQR